MVPPAALLQPTQLRLQLRDLLQRLALDPGPEVERGDLLLLGRELLLHPVFLPLRLCLRALQHALLHALLHRLLLPLHVCSQQL